MADEIHRQDAAGGPSRMTFGEDGSPATGAPPPDTGRLVMPGGTAPESDADVVAGVRSLFGGAGASAGPAPRGGALRGGVRPGPARTEGGVQLGREGTTMAGRPLPPTGVFHRPVAPQEPAAPASAPEMPSGAEEGLEWEDDGKIPLSMRLRAWLAGLEWNAKTISVLAAMLVLVALAGYFGARGRGAPAVPDAPGVALPAPEEPAPAAPLAVDPPVAVPLTVDAPVASPIAPPPEAPAAGPVPPPPPEASAPAPWTVPGCKIETLENGYYVVFEEPAFESVDNISKTGMAAFRLLAAKLKALDGGAQVLVTGYTDNVPMSKPTAKFKSNADIAQARAVAAAEHLKAFARNGALAFETAAGKESEAPYPNDTPSNRRRNRTATVRVVLPQ